MKRIKQGLAAMLVLSTLALGGCADSTGEDVAQPADTTDAPIKIAYFAPITGNMMQYGKSVSEGVQLAVQMANEQGGIDGRQIELVAYDDKGDPKESVNVANKITADPDIQVAIGSFASSASMAAAPVFEEAGVMQLAATCSHPDFVGMGEYMFSNAMSMGIEAKQYADNIVNSCGTKDTAIIYANTDWGVTNSENVRDRMEEQGVNVVAYESYISGQTTDFTPILAKIKERKPEVLYVAAATYQEGANIFKQAINLDMNTEYYAAGTILIQDFADLMGSTGDGIVVMCSVPMFTETALENADQATLDFIDAYQTAYNEVPDGFAANFFDATNMLLKVIEQTGYDAEAIEKLYREYEKYPGVSGTISLMDTKDVVRDVITYELHDGQFYLAK